MTLLVVGTVAFDTVETHAGRAERVLGGSAIHATFAATCFSPLALVGVVGRDFPDASRELLAARGVDLTGLVTHPTAPTFHWVGNYDGDLDESHTLAMTTAVHEGPPPPVPETARDATHVFLATDEPDVHLGVLDALRGEPFVLADTRECWISEQPEGLAAVMQRIDGLVLNAHEARLLAETHDVVEAGERLLARGPGFVIVKQAADGCLLFAPDGTTSMPADAVDAVRDPTGAGDAFAGGLIGRLASEGRRDLDAVRAALATAAVTGAMAVESFSVDAFRPDGAGHEAARRVVDARLAAYTARQDG